MAITDSELILRQDGTLYHLGIGPDDIAHKILIVGDPDRVPLVSAHFDKVWLKKSSREFHIHTGELRGEAISVLSSGIGVDNIDIVLNELDAAVNIDLSARQVKAWHQQLEIIRIGTCGAMHPDQQVGSAVVSAMAFAWDGFMHHYEYEPTAQEAALIHALDPFKPSAQLGRAYASSANSDLQQRVGAGLEAGITATANGFYGPQSRSVRLKPVPTAFMERYRHFTFSGMRISNFEMETAGLYALAAALGHKALTVCAILANRFGKEFHNDPSKAVQSLIRLVLERF